MRLTSKLSLMYMRKYPKINSILYTQFWLLKVSEVVCCVLKHVCEILFGNLHYVPQEFSVEISINVIINLVVVNLT